MSARAVSVVRALVLGALGAVLGGCEGGVVPVCVCPTAADFGPRIPGAGSCTSWFVTLPDGASIRPMVAGTCLNGQCSAAEQTRGCATGTSHTPYD